MKKLLLKFLIILSLQSSLSYGQTPDDILHNRLYHTCKVWGFVKYRHTEIANGNVDWDAILINALDGLKNAPTDEAFNDALYNMISQAGVMGTSTAILPPIPDDLNNSADLSWMDSPAYSSSVQELLDTIDVRFRPQNHVLVNEAFSNGNPTFDMDDSYYYAVSTSENVRLLALFRYWNIINYFFPYKSIMDQEWDSTLQEFIPLILDATSETDYQLTLKKLSTRINDSHAFFISDLYNQIDGIHFTPFLASFVENQMVITKVLSGNPDISVGDVITEMEGVDINVLIFGEI